LTFTALAKLSESSTVLASYVAEKHKHAIRPRSDEDQCDPDDGEPEDLAANATWRREVTIDDRTYALKMTCNACPEQYDVHLDGEQVGYLRLRHGVFTAETPDCGGKLVYRGDPKGDGMFEGDERELYLRAAVAAIDKEVRRVAEGRSLCEGCGKPSTACVCYLASPDA
jgi:hypothetical protein